MSVWILSLRFNFSKINAFLTSNVYLKFKTKKITILLSSQNIR